MGLYTRWTDMVVEYVKTKGEKVQKKGKPSIKKTKKTSVRMPCRSVIEVKGTFF